MQKYARPQPTVDRCLQTDGCGALAEAVQVPSAAPAAPPAPDMVPMEARAMAPEGAAVIAAMCVVDKLLVAVGRRAATKGLLADGTGVKLTDRGLVEVDAGFFLNELFALDQGGVGHQSKA